MSNLQTFNRQISDPKTQDYLASVLGEKKNEFVANLTAIVGGNPLLHECEPITLMYAALSATALNLPLDKNLGFAYVVPFKNSQKQIIEAQFQIGYKGLRQLAVRSGQFETIAVKPVYEGQMVEDNSFDGFHFEWSKKTSDKLIGYASYFKLINGYESTLFMTIEQLEAHGKTYSQSYKSTNKYVQEKSLWNTNKPAMYEKTVAKLHLNRGEAPLSSELQKAIKSDQAVLRNENEPDYVDAVSTEVNKETERFSLLIADCKTIAELENLRQQVPDELLDTFLLKEQELKTPKSK